jgi:hypothetical protein
MTDEHQREPELLDERHVKSAADFNREMTILSWPYRMQEPDGEGIWTLTDTRSSEIVHRTPPVDEAVAVHIMRAWMRGYIHDGNFTIIGQYLLGNMPDDTSPY